MIMLLQGLRKKVRNLCLDSKLKKVQQKVHNSMSDYLSSTREEVESLWNNRRIAVLALSMNYFLNIVIPYTIVSEH